MSGHRILMVETAGGPIRVRIDGKEPFTVSSVELRPVEPTREELAIRPLYSPRPILRPSEEYVLTLHVRPVDGKVQIWMFDTRIELDKNDRLDENGLERT